MQKTIPADSYRIHLVSRFLQQRIFLSLCLCFLALFFVPVTPAFAKLEIIGNSEYTLSTAIDGVIDVDLDPSAVGSTITDTQRLNITTTCPQGYDLYIHMDGGDNKIHRLADVADKTDYYLSPVVGTIESPSTLGNNQWGFNIDSSTTRFARVPASPERIFTLDYFNPFESNTDSSVTDINFTYGLRADTNVAAGNYVGTVIYTVIPNPICAMSVFERAYHDDGKEPVPAPDGKTYYKMQDMNQKICNAVPTPGKTTLKVPEITLIDTRDNELYTVRKLADGNCWTAENLRLKLAADKPLTPADTDVIADFVPTLDTQPAATKTNWGSASASNANKSRSYDTENPNYGVYYNWYTATAGVGAYAYTTATASIGSSICPRGWQLPTGYTQDVDKSFYRLVYSYLDKAGATNAINNTAPFWQVFNIQLSGYYANNTTSPISYQGSREYFWSASTTTTSGSGYTMYLTASNVNTQSSSAKTSGFSVRCVNSDKNVVNFDVGEGVTSDVYSILLRAGDRINLADYSMRFIKDGYYVKEWKDQDGNSYVPLDINADVNPSNKPEVTLTAVWDKISYFPSNITTMQDMTANICESVTTPKKTATIDAKTAEEYDNIYTKVPTVILRDVRDDNVYTVKKLADGNCWMTDNLNLRISENTPVPAASTDTTTDFIPTLSTQPTATTTTSWGAYNSAANVNTSRSYAADSGVLYNWYTATAGSGLYANNTVIPIVKSSICPKGWRLPTGFTDNVSKSFNYLVYAYLGTTGATNVINESTPFWKVFNIQLPGYYNYSSGIANPGARQYFWTASASTSSSSAYAMYLTATNANPQQTIYKANGFSVRCVARSGTPENNSPLTQALEDGGADAKEAPDGKTYFEMQGMTSSICAAVAKPAKTVLDPPQATMIDIRDNQLYIVKKFADGNCWMGQNLRLVGPMLLTNMDSDISAESGFILPSLSPEDYRFTTITDPLVAPPRAESGNGAYYNFPAATAGTSPTTSSDSLTPASICPKNWRLPIGSNSNNKSFGYLLSSYGYTKPAQVIVPPLNFELGRCYDTKGFCGQSGGMDFGDYWSASKGTAGGWSFGIDPDDNWTGTNKDEAWFGFNIRCVSR